MRTFFDGLAVLAGVLLGVVAVIWLVAGLGLSITRAPTMFAQVAAMLLVFGVFHLLARLARWLRRRGRRHSGIGERR